ncbi:TBC domain-containing protein kinase-like protein [Ctenocephalides felis]|uniref:TBC domain-containing protein kinase-like protein n=1 Tax=Ctenocephalides felis TaxID=7515 RepID=UPI000E6E57B3|nr:TBC domain-containing protein kinase-like protein [Ctenocephalides felis]
MCPVISSNVDQVSLFAAVTFFARCHPVETCGSNGLPLTPYSIAILGRAQILKTICHENLCQYLDIVRGKHERTIIVAQYSGRTLAEHCASELPNISINFITKVAKGLVNGIKHLHSLGITHRNLSPENILIGDNNEIKLFNYGLYYMTLNGKYVSFPIGYPKYMAPEVLLGGPQGDNYGPKTDIWTIGLIILELSLQCIVWPTLKLPQIMRKILSLLPNKNIPERIAREHNLLEKYQSLDNDLKVFLESCLNINPKERLTAEELLKFKMFDEVVEDHKNISTKKSTDFVHPLLRCELKQIYSLWQLAGGDVQLELKKQGLLKNRPPILSLPNLVMLNGITYGAVKDQSSLYDPKVVQIQLTNLMSRLTHVKFTHYWPLLHCPKYKNDIIRGSTELPLIIRERDTEYQFHRIILFNRLLKGYPYTRDMLLSECSIDIPPLYRGEIWACLLGVNCLDIEREKYASIDKETPTQTDRQIEVDIPRCHQYNELLSSPTGHASLKRILKAWVLSNPQYVYWQGLDSLTAPFLHLNFTDEALAYASLSRFVSRYLRGFFRKDNSKVIGEYLGKFSQLTAYHEPKLAVHLANIGFIPELFAIPWFLTMFSHVFPIHKILHLWDRLLLGDSSFPLYIGLSILKRLESVLMSSGFNECILLFSDLPEQDIESCLEYSTGLYESTPKSITWRCNEADRGDQEKRDEFDISDVEIKDLQKEFCPRISAKDFVGLLRERNEELLAVDIRSSIQFSRACVTGSINIPFTSVQLDAKDLDAFGTPGVAIQNRLGQANIVVLGCEYENVLLIQIKIGSSFRKRGVRVTEAPSSTERTRTLCSRTSTSFLCTSMVYASLWDVMA